jgi:hypothetical protein
LAIGLKETIKFIQSNLEGQGSRLVVFVVHDKEHIDSSS